MIEEEQEDYPMQPPSLQPAAAPTPAPIPQQRITPQRMSREMMEAYTTPPAPRNTPAEQVWNIPELGHGVLTCGECPKWKRAHPLAPFGQCLAAMRFLGSPMYTPDMGACSWTQEQRQKAR